jgi:hypothetical protein
MSNKFVILTTHHRHKPSELSYLLINLSKIQEAHKLVLVSFHNQITAGDYTFHALVIWTNGFHAYGIN